MSETMQEPSVSTAASFTPCRERTRRYAFLVKQIVAQMPKRSTRHSETNDLIQSGLLALLEADQRYLGAPDRFHEFARREIRAAVRTHTSRCDSGPRWLQRSKLDLDFQRHRLEQLLSRPPTERELAAAAGLSLEAYHRVVSDRFVPLQPRLDTAERLDGLGDSGGDLLQIALHRSEQARLRNALRRLRPRERRMMKLHYRGDKLKSIGTSFGVTESRVSQILSRTVERLRAELAVC